jgi:hypothetical protein
MKCKYLGIRNTFFAKKYIKRCKPVAFSSKALLHIATMYDHSLEKYFSLIIRVVYMPSSTGLYIDKIEEGRIYERERERRERE